MTGLDEAQEVRVKVVRAYSKQSLAHPKLTSLRCRAPRELVCYALKLKMLALNVPCDFSFSEDFSSVVIILKEPLSLKNFENIDARMKDAWELFDDLYKDFIEESEDKDMDGVMYREVLSVFLTLSLNPAIIPAAAVSRKAYYACPLGIHSLN